jgi:hypothetical protein
MGAYLSKKREKKEINIHNFNRLIIPKEYELIKISTYNINIRNTVNLNSKTDEIISYILGKYKSKEIDIMCIQGIHDCRSASKLVHKINEVCTDTLYFAPEFQEFKDGSTNVSVNHRTGSQKKSQSKKKHVQNIIISRYPIVTTIYSELDGEIEIDDVLGTQTLIGANISIFGNIISVYNVSLCKDIKSANIINNDVREKELISTFNAINKNKNNLNTKAFNHYMKTDIHFLIGSFNIKDKYDLDENNELASLIKRWHCVDVFRSINENRSGYTNTAKERIDYIFFLFSDKVYNNKSNYKKLAKVNDNEDLLNFIFKIFKVYFIDCYVRKDTYIGNSFENFPIECVMMINKNKH